MRRTDGPAEVMESFSLGEMGMVGWEQIVKDPRA